MSRRIEDGTKVGWLLNYHSTSTSVEESDDNKESVEASALCLLFYDLAGELFECTLKYSPYFFVAAVEGREREVELGLVSTFQTQLLRVEQVDKEDLDQVNHLSGRKHTFLKLIFSNTSDLTAVRGKIEAALRRNASAMDANPLDAPQETELGTRTALDKAAWMKWLADIREYDVKYYVRVAIDLSVYVGAWYEVTVTQGDAKLTACDDSKYHPPMPRICAFDIETTKAPLKFPQPEVDQVYMISYMLDARGFLIVNREFVAEDIAPFDYTPTQEYEGVFTVFNEPDEEHLLRRFFDEMQHYQPMVYVSYNGDYFDFPFITARADFHGMSVKKLMGFGPTAEGATLSKLVPHIDCFYWVKRDSYLPQGSQGLKAVTRAKLGYDPIEVDPEDMLPLAQSNPQRMASYSVSDAVSTYYLYMKYVHPFIFSLCTIIPMPPDDVLRKGSGTLCESLLMVQAYAKGVVFPNKKQQEREKFFNGHLIDSETYIGGHVEALESGVFRSNLPMKFHCNPQTYDVLLGDVDNMLHFSIVEEGGMKMDQITNYAEVRDAVIQKLTAIRDQPIRNELPMIYHLDVGAMYPNIILTNRLQPPSMVTPDMCAGCCFNSATNDNHCKRTMSWVWRGEMFTAGRYEYARIKAQLESERFSEQIVTKTNASATTKKNYGQRRGNVLEGTAFEKKFVRKQQFDQKGHTSHQKREFGPSKPSNKTEGGEWKEKKWNRNQGQRYRRDAAAAPEDEASAQSGSGSSDDEEEEGGQGKRFHKLAENTQFLLVKKRLAEYCRKAFRKTHESREMLKEHTVCQRENSFYVDTVRLFRDRRYHYKRELKRWKEALAEAKEPAAVKAAKSRCVQMESLQLAHKCILNSFYGYVMRKGSRWYSMEMAGIVTYLGATLITMARQLVQDVGVPLELDTDGIWCCLPASFPDSFTFKTSNPKKPKLAMSYPCVMLNKTVHDRYTNDQYQELVKVGVYNMHSECSIAFEVDGPYLAMVLPASREEGKSIKKRYAVFHLDGKLAELKGFELKRRGELMLIKDFQSQVFKRFLDGKTLVEAYASVAVVANSALDMLYSQGEGFEEEEIVEKLTESSSMSRRLDEYGENQKSLALTTARRIAEFLGPQMVKDKGLSCRFVIAKKPIGRPVTERAIPLNIFKAEPAVAAQFLRKWTGDNSINSNDIRKILDWEYYIARFAGCVQKIITIPAALQDIPNPVVRVKHPDWLEKRTRGSKYRQTTLSFPVGRGVKDIEDLVTAEKPAPKKVSLEGDHDSEEREESEEESESDQGNGAQRNEADEATLTAFRKTYFAAGSTQLIDSKFYDDKGYHLWAAQRREQWLHRAHLRLEFGIDNGSELAATGGNDLFSNHQFIDARAKALSTRWHVLEMRDGTDAPNIVRVFAMLDGVLYTLKCIVDRRVLVDFCEAPPPIPNSRPVVGRILPQRRNAESLLEVTVNSHKSDGDAMVADLRFGRDDVAAVYEADVPLSRRLILQIGCVCSVNVALHSANVKSRLQRDAFHADELELCASHEYLANYTTTLNPLFLFVASADTRAMIGLFLASNDCLIIIVQPAAAQRTSVVWSSVADEAAESILGQRETASKLRFDVRYSPDLRTAWKTVDQAIADSASNARRPQLAVIHSSVPTAAMLASVGVPSLNSLPILRLAGAQEDEKLLAASALMWHRELSRRMLQRFFAYPMWLEDRMSLCRMASIPLCNAANDIQIYAWDTLFSRSLHQHGHVLWDRSDPEMTVAPQERPTRVATPSGNHTYCVEFEVSQLEAIAVLFSQMIQEGDDPGARALCDGGVTSQFHVLRDVVSEIYGLAVAKKDAAVALLLNFSRWLHDTYAVCYEPKIVTLVSSLVNRALATLLIRIAKLGGRVVRADTRCVMVATPKRTFDEAVNFAAYIVRSLKTQPMLHHMALRVSKYWLVFVIHDLWNWYGLWCSVPEAGCIPPKRPTEHNVSAELSLWNIFDENIKRLVLLHLTEFLNGIVRSRDAALDEVEADASVTLATKTEKVAERAGSLMSQLVESELQPRIISDTNQILNNPRTFTVNTTGGSEVPQGTSAAVEFPKALCELLQLVPEVSAAVRRTKNNCLRLCGVGSFAPLAMWQDPSPAHQVTMIETSCAFCNGTVSIDLLAGAQDGHPAPREWRCPSCSNAYSRELVELFLVGRVQQMLVASCEEDAFCLKCRAVAPTLLSITCQCSGNLGRKVVAPHQSELRALETVAALYHFSTLDEAVKAAKDAFAR